MVVLNIVADGTKDASGPPFDPDKVLHVKGTVSVIGMPRGTANGLPSVMLRATLPDGREVFIETTLTLFVTAANALQAYYTRSA